MDTRLESGWPVYQGFGLVSLGLERILDSFMPKTVSGGRLGLDHFRVVVVSPSLGQILGNFVLKTVGEDWFSSGLVSSALAWADPGQHGAQDCKCRPA